MSASTKVSSHGIDVGKNKTSTYLAVEILKSMILDNRLAPGSNHLESELAKLLGMSRTPVREATLILAAQGLLEVKPRHGVRILSLSSRDMSEIYEILTELESLSAELAAGKSLSDEEFIAPEKAISDMDQALEENNREAWAMADEAFHNELARLGGNQRIATILAMYNDQVRRARFLTLHLRPDPGKSNQDHNDVLDAIRQGDAQRARTLHRAHRMQAKIMLVGLLEKYGFHNV
jgi:DNA-binding GntR family transcriptional regulator